MKEVHLGEISMADTMTFNDLLEAIGSRSVEEQEMIAEIVHKRIIDRRRKDIKESIHVSRQEYKDGVTGHGTVEDFEREIDKG